MKPYKLRVKAKKLANIVSEMYPYDYILNNRSAKALRALKRGDISKTWHHLDMLQTALQEKLKGSHYRFRHANIIRNKYLEYVDELLFLEESNNLSAELQQQLDNAYLLCWLNCYQFEEVFPILKLDLK